MVAFFVNCLFTFNAKCYFCKKVNLQLKRYIAILMLLALSFRPVFYLGQVTYYELNIDYIVQNYCVNKDKPKLQCNGKCHLAKQLQLTTAENSNLQDQAIVSAFEGFLPVFQASQTQLEFNSPFYSDSHKVVIDYNNNYRFLFSGSSFKPPSIIVI